jgi:hypothetical protein
MRWPATSRRPCQLALTEAVIPGLAPEPSIFAARPTTSSCGISCSTRWPTCPEASRRERAYLEFMFDRWSYRATCGRRYLHRRLRPGALRGGFAYYRAIPETIRQNGARAAPAGMPVLAIGAEHATGDAPLLTLQPHADDCAA